MEVDGRLIDYIDYLSWELPEYLRDIYENAMTAKVPVIRKPAQSFLKVLLSMQRPKNILEIGTAVGFSSMFMSEFIDSDSKITTIELIPERIKTARENFEKFGKTGQITLLEGDAGEYLKKFSEDENFKVDFVFMDAAQAQYIYYLPFIRKIMVDGGVLLTDNVLHDGDIIESRYSVNRRDRTVHTRMREFLQEITHSEGMKTSILPIGDGMSVTCFRK